MGALVAREHPAPHLNSLGSWGERDLDDALRGSWRLNPNQLGTVSLQMAMYSEGTGPLTQADDQDERGRLLPSIRRAQKRSPGESLTRKGPLHTRCGQWNHGVGGWRGGRVQFYTCPSSRTTIPPTRLQKGEANGVGQWSANRGSPATCGSWAP